MDEPRTDRSADERLAAFTAELGDLKRSTGRAQRDRWGTIAGLVAMAAGVVVALGGYVASLDVKTTPGTNSDVLTSTSYEILAVVGLAIALVGGFVFLRCSLASFLRFWLLRQSYEQQAAVERAAGAATTPAAPAPAPDPEID